MPTPPKSLYTKPQYPIDWPLIATEIKEAKGWRCETCGRTASDPPYYIITVHHKDHNTFNNDPSNLVVLCQACHIRLEGKYRSQNAYTHRIGMLLSSGQQALPGFKQAID